MVRGSGSVSSGTGAVEFSARLLVSGFHDCHFGDPPSLLRLSHNLWSWFVKSVPSSACLRGFRPVSWENGYGFNSLGRGRRSSVS